MPDLRNLSDLATLYNYEKNMSVSHSGRTQILEQVLML